MRAGAWTSWPINQLVGGQRFRLLTLVDNHSRESLAIEAGQRLTGDDAVRVLEQGMPIYRPCMANNSVGTKLGAASLTALERRSLWS